jgi:histone H3/H4|eukprot:COSAG01_NODE_3798_length_5687_cov_133.802613_6_plen_163_part_00
MESLPLRAGRVECIPDIEHDMLEQTLAIIASMMQQAAHDATLYCAEAKRIVVMPRDIELALKRLVLPGSAYWTRDDLSEEAQQIRHRLFVDASSEESDSGDSWVTDVGGEWSETAESDLTREMNAAPALFDKWQPEGHRLDVTVSHRRPSTGRTRSCGNFSA